jgi:polar amino acid transport system substrate-binding protein
MKSNTILVKIIITVFFGLLANASDTIQPLTETWTPYQIETKDGLKGISVDLVREIQNRIGNTKDIKVFPC